MRTNRLLWQLYPTQLVITILALLAVTWYGTHSIRTFHVEQTAQGLTARAALVKDKIHDILDTGDYARLDQFCKEIGEASATRLTVILPTGKVVADSVEEPSRMENHADRPEVVAALSGHAIPSMRFSYTLQQRLMYVAIPLTKNNTPIAILRTSIPLTAVDHALRQIYMKIAFSSIWVALAVALVAWFFSRRISTPLEDMRHGAENFANGNFNKKLREEGTEEIASLARAMNKMASHLDERIRTVVRQRNELEAVFSSMVEGVLTVDTEERILGINRAGARLLKVDFAKVKGKNTMEAVRNTDLQRFVKRALASPETIDGEIILADTSGSERFFYLHGTGLSDDQGKSTGALIVINDVTNLRRLENVRRDFVANVSHELKTPITSIEGFVETLLDGAMDDPEDARRFLEIIAKQSKRLHAIVEDLLALSRIEQEANREEIPLQRLTLLESLQSARQNCLPKAESKNVGIEMHCPDDLAAMINPALFEQAVGNLIDNAVKYNPEGSRVVVLAAKQDSEVLISVTDNGVGVSQEDLPRLFERFYRVDKARSNKLGGTGLGLSIVKHIIQAHKGYITVDSTLGLGSTFTIHLPAIDEQ